jgi:hypothetical protein
MDQETLVDALTKHLDLLQSYLETTMLLAVAAAWAGVRRAREIEAFGTKFDRRHAFWALAAIYLVANVTVLELFLRIGDLIALIDRTGFPKAFTRIATHPWILNPFASFDHSTVAKVYASEGYGLLIATWWLCNTSLSTLMDDKKNRIAVALLVIFVAVGLASILAIERAQAILLVRLHAWAPQLGHDVDDTRPERVAGTIIGITVGLLLFFSANRLQQRLAVSRSAG